MRCECGHEFEPVVEYRHRLICGDSTEPAVVERLMAGERAGMAWTDPPYGVEYDPGWRNEAAAKGLIAFAARREGEVLNDDRADWREAYALFPGDVACVWHAGIKADVVAESLEAAGFIIRSQIVWVKSNFAISRGHYHVQHEPCFYAVRKGGSAHWIGDRSQTTAWKIPWDDNAEGGHGTQKPLECMERPLRNHAGDVYDPFLGSGTTLIAAHRTGRRCFAVEMSAPYVAVALERFAQMTGEAPVLLEPAP